VLDRDSDAVFTVPVDIDPQASEAPHHLAIAGDEGAAFVALAFPAPPSTGKSPHASHGNAEYRGKLAKVRLDTLAVVDTREVDENPGDIILTHDGRFVIVTHFDMKRAMNVAAKGGTASAMFASIQLWSRKDLRLFGSRPICVAPHGMFTTADDKLAVVACYGSDELVVVDLTSPNLPVSHHAMGSAPGVPGAPQYGPYFVEPFPSGNLVLVADLEAKDVRVFDLGTRKFDPERTIDLGARALQPVFANETAIVPLQAPDGLVRVDFDKRAVVARAQLSPSDCALPHAARRAPDGRVYVVCEGDHKGPGTVIEVDPQTLAITKRWVVGVYPDGIAFR
jgi:DNA-binding beta-propeller fold protein YncE